jgi:hypothetical protein
LAFGEEIEFFRKNGIPHLALQTANGSVIDTTENQEITDDGEGKERQE